MLFFLCEPLEQGSLVDLHFPGFPGSTDSKESACNAGDPGLIPGSGSSPGEGNGNPLQYSCLENPMDRGAWWATPHGSQSRTLLSDVQNHIYMLVCSLFALSLFLTLPLPLLLIILDHLRQRSRLHGSSPLNPSV